MHRLASKQVDKALWSKSISFGQTGFYSECQVYKSFSFDIIQDSLEFPKP